MEFTKDTNLKIFNNFPKLQMARTQDVDSEYDSTPEFIDDEDDKAPFFQSGQAIWAFGWNGQIAHGETRLAEMQSRIASATPVVGVNEANGLAEQAKTVSIRTFQFGHLVTTSLTRGEGQCDGRCVQTSGRHSYNLAGPTITTDSRLTVSSCRRRAQHDPRTM